MRGPCATAALVLLLGSCGGGSSAVTPAQSSVPFAALGSPSPAGTPFPLDLAVGWFDGDAYPDVATLETLGGGIRILLGQPGGAYDLRAPQTFGVPNPPQHVRAGFFDLDAYEDLVVTGFDSHVVLLGNGDGTFAPAQGAVLPLLPGRFPREIAVGRWNADAFDDVVYGTGDGHVGLALSTGGGTFVQGGDVALPFVDQVKAMAVADLDLDGDLDVVVLQNDKHLSVLEGDGAGGLALAAPPFLLGGTPAALAVGRFDAVSGLDLAVLDDLHRQVRLLSGVPGPTFSLPPIATVSLPQDGLAIATYPRLLDPPESLVVITFDPNAFTDGHLLFLTGDATSGLWSSTEVPTGTRLPLSAAVADVDLDGRADLIVGAAISELAVLDGVVRAFAAVGP